jgi:RNA polymerase sigma factor for flagellar operon FliA
MGARLQSFGRELETVLHAGLGKCSPDVEQIVKSYGMLVRPIARKIFLRTGNHIDIDDLVQIGRVALVECAYAFVDRDRDRFAAYATMRMRGAMIDELRRTATISRGAIRFRRRFDKARNTLAGGLGRQPCTAEMAQQVQMSVPDYSAAEATTHGLEFAPMLESYSDHDQKFADLATPDAHATLEIQRTQGDISTAVGKLSRREQIVLHLFFVEELSLADIGEELEICGARVCQIKKAALARLRPKLGGWVVN